MYNGINDTAYKKSWAFVVSVYRHKFLYIQILDIYVCVCMYVCMTIPYVLRDVAHEA